MPLSTQEVQHIAELARLSLTQADLELYRQQLSDILEYATSLNELDTTGISPTSSVLVMQAPLRSDRPQAGFTTQQTLQNAPHSVENQFKVPPVME
ncbi:MAG: hypothetical protein BGO78_06325 [Chloroflexi bacterium 44-23]|nr:MAG: hypothetical protein BGO78_06325 [Chloroflexi bacterium 44-23]